MVLPIDRFLTPEQRLVVRIAVAVVAGLFVISGVLALVMFAGGQVAIAGMVLFSLLLFVGGPMWLAVLQDALEEQHAHRRDVPHGPDRRTGAA